MDTRKVTFIATIAAIILVAVGIGYAYTASTVNSGNNASSEYITLVQGDETPGAYQFANNEKIYWDSADYRVGEQPKTDFSLASETIDVTTALGANCTYKAAVQVGSPFYLKASITGAATAASVNVDIRATDIAAPYQTDKAYVVFKVYNGTAAETQYLVVTANAAGVNTLTAYDSSWVAAPSLNNKLVLYQNNASSYKNATITAYYVTAVSAITVNHDVNAIPAGPDASPLNNAKLVFSITKDSWNGSGTAVTGISVTPTSVTITGTGSQTVTVTVSGDSHATNKNFIAFSNNAGVATVAITNATTITITGVAPGTTTITLITEEGGYTVDIPVTVNAP